MPTPPDHYATLGVKEDAGLDEIKKSFRSLARETHPDRKPDDKDAAERFRRVQAAYEVLGDPAKRREYDRMRKDPFAGQAFGGFQGGGQERVYRAPDGTYVRMETSGAGPDQGFIFDADLEDILGGRRRGRQGSGSRNVFDSFFSGQAEQQQGVDQEMSITVPFREALSGGPREVSLPDGTKVRVMIPKGAADGFKLRLRGRGARGPAGPGDLFVVIRVAPDPDFKREGLNLVTKLQINIAEAVLGVTREIQNPHGARFRLTIAPGTQPGDRLRLRGQGVDSGSEKGDLFVEVDVAIPTNLPELQKETFTAWAREAGLIPADESGSAVDQAAEES